LVDEPPVRIPRKHQVRVEMLEQPAHLQEARIGYEPGSCSVAAPGPLIRLGNDTSSNRIQHDVTTQFKQIRFFLHKHRMVPPLEEVAYSVVALVEPLRVHRVQPFHATRQVGLRGLDQ